MDTVITRDQREAVHATPALTGHHDLLIGKLPGIRNARQQRHAALVAVEQVNVTLLGKLLELGQALTLELVLELVNVGIGRVFQTPSQLDVCFRRRRNWTCVSDAVALA